MYAFLAWGLHLNLGILKKNNFGSYIRDKWKTLVKLPVFQNESSLVSDSSLSCNFSNIAWVVKSYLNKLYLRCFFLLFATTQLFEAASS